MNLEQSIQWINKRIEELESKEAPPAQIQSYKKFASWLEELLRYRLFYSEVLNEIDQSENDFFTKERLVKFLEEEHEEWRLEVIIP